MKIRSGRLLLEIVFPIAAAEIHDAQRLAGFPTDIERHQGRGNYQTIGSNPFGVFPVRWHAGDPARHPHLDHRGRVGLVQSRVVQDPLSGIDVRPECTAG